MKWLLFIVLCLIWGSSFVLMKAGLEALSPFQVASIRIIFAGIFMLPFAKKAYSEVPKEVIRPIIISGFLGTFFPAYFFCIAQTKIDSSLAGILNALTPLATIAIGTTFFNMKLGWTKWLGMILGFAGMLVLLLNGNKDISFQYVGYALFVVIATLCYGLNVNVVSKYLHNAAPMQIATIAFTSLIIPTLIILASTGYFTDPRLLNGEWTSGTISAAVLGIIGTGVASVTFYVLMKKAGPVFASMVTYGIPFVAIAWGISTGETITAMQMAGMVIILLGVKLAN
ncbi:MAG: DMT family transporter [Chitinophagaceae bacterium]|jgi:drug/metabolite transporter (DMT)-like permease